MVDCGTLLPACPLDLKLGITHHAAGGGCFTTCGSSALMQAQRGADDVQIVTAGLARFGSSKVPTRTKIR